MTKKKGRGLAFLLGERPVQTQAVKVAAASSVPTEEGVYGVDIDRLEPSPFQPRQKMDEGALNDLAASLRTNGMLQPILVRPCPERAGYYQIIGGERRWRAARRAELQTVPVHVRRFDDREARAAALVENLQRHDLNAVEEAEGLQILQSTHNLNQETLSQLVGKSRSHIANTLRLLKLPEPVRLKLMSNEITAGHARALLSNPDPVAALEIVLRKGLNVRQTEALAHVKEDKKAIPQSPLGEKTEKTAAILDDRLGLKDLGIKIRTKITKSDKGSLMISWDNEEQLENLLKRLNER